MFLSIFLVAFGTSLPELITTIRFVKKGHLGIVIGNVLDQIYLIYVFNRLHGWFDRYPSCQIFIPRLAF